jgi:ABC-type antimicrobial peptide transport system permease subunit
MAHADHGRRAPARPGLAGPSPAALLTVAGIGLGAALIFASWAVGRGVERSIERTVEVTLGRSNFRVSALDGGTLSQEMLVTIRSVHGVEVAAPAVEHPATLLPEIDTASSESPVTIHGIDPALDGQIRDLDLVAGITITRPDEAAAIITERLAAEEDYGLGSEVIVATPGEAERFRVIGIAAGDGPLAASGGRTVTLPIEAVARMFGLDGVARVDLLVAEGVPLDGVRAELAEVLAGEQYVLTSPTDLGESLRRPTAGFAVTAAGIAVLGTLVGALVVFSVVGLAARASGEAQVPSRVREAALRGAMGSGVGAVLAFVLAALTGSDVAPAALGLGGTVVAIVVVVLVALAAGALPPTRVALPPARLLGVLAIVLGLVVAIATVGANAHRVATEQVPAPVLGRVAAQIDAQGLLAVVVAALAIVGAVTMSDRERLAPRDAGTLGLAGAVVGSVAGLAVGTALIVLGGGRVDPAVDLPWAALGLSLVLGVGLSVAAAWFPARLGRRVSSVRAVRIG